MEMSDRFENSFTKRPEIDVEDCDRPLNNLSEANTNS